MLKSSLDEDPGLRETRRTTTTPSTRCSTAGGFQVTAYTQKIVFILHAGIVLWATLVGDVRLCERIQSLLRLIKLTPGSVPPFPM
jgi:hypothetical protein